MNVGDLLCGTSIAFIESIESINSIESSESVESSFRLYRVYRVYRAYRIYSFGTRGFQKMGLSIFGIVILMHVCMSFVTFRPRDPSKKLRHVVRINLVQFSAPELH